MLATGIFDESAAEIPAFDPITDRLFVVNAQAVAVEVLDISDPTNPSKIGQINASAGKEAGKIEGKVEGKIEGKIEGKMEAKVETIPDLVKFGLTVEQIASILKLDVELVKKVAQSSG